MWDCDGIPHDEYNDYDGDVDDLNFDHDLDYRDDNNNGIADVFEPGNRLNEIPREC